MIINHNIAALNTYRQLSTNNVLASKSLEKLSSGLRINRAGDDAAGLAISEKMRGQIRGLNQAVRNAQDGISLIQTAEGALNETHAILQRMRELAVQAANETTTDFDRKAIQAEIDELAREMTRISNTTEFNTKNLLAGGFNSVFHVGANKDQNVTLKISAMDAKSLGVAADEYVTTFNGTNTGISKIDAFDGSGGYKVQVKAYDAQASTVNRSNSSGGTATVDAANYTIGTPTNYIVRIDNVDTGKVTAASYSLDGGLTWVTASVDSSGADAVVTVAYGVKVTITTDTDNAVNDTYSFRVDPRKLEFTLLDSGNRNVGDTKTVYSGVTSVTFGDPTKDKLVTAYFDFANVFQTVGATNTKSDTIYQTVKESKAATVDAIGNVITPAVAYKGIKVTTQNAANSAITIIDNAINTVSNERSKLGALQNRLEHTINNLGTASENLTAAESRIRDIDMAKEMMEYTKMSILQQAATAMLEVLAA